MARRPLSAGAVLGTIGLLAFTPRCDSVTFRLLPVESGGSAGLGGFSGANSNSGGKPGAGGATSGGTASSGGSTGSGGKFFPGGSDGRGAAGGGPGFGGRPPMGTGGDSAGGKSGPRPCEEFCPAPPMPCLYCDPRGGPPCPPGLQCLDCGVCVECRNRDDCQERAPKTECDNNKRCTQRCGPDQPPCPDNRPVCKENRCVECDDPRHCANRDNSRKLCDTVRNVCVECAEDAQCSATGSCNTTRMVCSECERHENCPITGTCQERAYCWCGRDEDCLFSSLGSKCMNARCGCFGPLDCPPEFDCRYGSCVRR